MLLDRIDIDAHGPLHRVELGPFAEHLNVICGPDSSGKTAIVRFIRDSLVGREYPLGMLSSSTGRVVWADRNGLVHCRREKDGTAKGRRTVEFESRGDDASRFGSLGQSWLAGISSTDSRRTTESLKLPESIVDGVITDTAIISVARVVSACVRSGLDSAEFLRSLPAAEESIYNRRDGYVPCQDDAMARDDHHAEQHRRLREEMAAIDVELARLAQVRPSRGNDRVDGESHWSGGYPERHRRLLQLHDRARELRARQNEHRRWIAEIDHDLSRSGGHYLNRWRSSDHSVNAAIVDERLRSRLDDLDAQMIHWRRALSEIRGLRQAFLDGRPSSAPLPSYDEATLRRMRLDGFIHAIDRYDHSCSWDDFYPDRFRPLYEIDDIDYRIDSATRHIDWLLERYTTPEHGHYGWYRANTQAMNQRAHADLQNTLRSVRDDLRQVQRHALNRHGIGSAESGYAESLSNDPGFTRGRRQQADIAGTAHSAAIGNGFDLLELRRNEDWILNAMNQLNSHREELLRDSSAELNAEIASLARDNEYDLYILDRDRRENVGQLGRINAELEACLQEAAQVRRSMRSLPIVDSRWYDDRNDWSRPLAADPSYDVRDNDLPVNRERIALLERQRAEIVRKLESAQPHRAGDTSRTVRSPLSEIASRWLVRLSAGRLSRVEWPHHLFRGNASGYHGETTAPTGVVINGRDETEWGAADRALAAVSVRMAAGELLGRCGRQVPLVVETHHELQALPVFGANEYGRTGFGFDPTSYSRVDANAADSYGYLDGDDRKVNSIVAALRDYARAGRQIVMLTSNSPIAHEMSRVGARSFEVYPERILHPHRPLWKPHYQAESYVGPHPHLYGHYDADEVVRGDRSILSRGADINRDFDVAWREAHGLGGQPNHRHGSPHPVDAQRSTPESAGHSTSPSLRTDWPRDGARHRDGYYFAESFTTVEPNSAGVTRVTDDDVKPPVVKKPDSPFFLSVDSPIDQAPSVDAVAAARLRGLKVTHVNHLMQQDPNRLSDALGLANVDAATIRRWQAECRLVCRVPQLRGFDARVLVGCGITTPARLASIHPVDLLQEVEAFLATERGQKLLLSGSSQELSRITSWIAAANANDGEVGGFDRNRSRDYRLDPRSEPRRRQPYDIAGDRDFDSDRYEYDSEDGVTPNRDGRSRRRRIIRSDGTADAVANSQSRTDRDGTRSSRRRAMDRSQQTSGRGSGDAAGNRSTLRSGRGSAGRKNSRSGSDRSSSNSDRSGRRSVRNTANGGNQIDGQRDNRSRSARRRRSDRDGQDLVRYDRDPREPREYRQREYESHVSGDREPRVSSERSERESREETGSVRELKFYLHREDAVVDAPSIGNRMAERLNAIGIHTVDDLLNADPTTVANELGHKRVDEATVLQWQQQATLVCRVPMLRGHDAQLLVAADVTTPEELAQYEPAELFEIVDPISRSSEGKRFIRGGKAPDLEEIADWIQYGQQHRELRAA